MEFRLLGPFEAEHEGQSVIVGRRRQERCLLSILLLHSGQVVTTGHLADLLWDGAPPESARTTIHTYVGRLRRQLEPYGLDVQTRGDAYIVPAGGHTTDVEEFTALTRQAAGSTDPGERIGLYDRALRLWRGPLLADLADEQLRHRLDRQLDELRLSALQLRAADQLSIGQHDRVVTDLTPLAGQHATQERLVETLMTALYRCGRQGDALELYRATRAALVADLGIEPGAKLQKLHERMLRSDPELDRPAAPFYAIRVRDQWLPWHTSGYPALEFCNTYAGWRGPEPAYCAARSATELLADPKRYLIRACASPRCGWLFLDQSGMRRWCSIATCGGAQEHATG